MFIIDFKEVKDQAFATACEKGFHKEEHPNRYHAMFIISELCEVLEADRKGLRADFVAYQLTDKTKEDYEQYIKDTFEDEIVDVILRTLDYASIRQIDINEALTMRTPRLTTRQPFPEYIFAMVDYVCITYYCKPMEMVAYIINNLLQLCIDYNIPLEVLIADKMDYNKTRDYLNGKKY